MMDLQRNARGEVVICIDGVFDRQAASRLVGWIGEVRSAERLVLDFSRVREFHDFGLAEVATALTRRESLQVVGLGRHQERLLRYFGVELGGLAGLAAGEDEAVG